jgi:hypothetical protein
MTGRRPKFLGGKPRDWSGGGRARKARGEFHIENFVRRQGWFACSYCCVGDDGRVAIAFKDCGSYVSVPACGRKAIVGAMRLAQEKWGSFEVSGGRDFLAVCVEVAIEHGFELRNPDLMEQVRAGRERRQAKAASESSAPMPGPAA